MLRAAVVNTYSKRLALPTTYISLILCCDCIYYRRKRRKRKREREGLILKRNESHFIFWHRSRQFAQKPEKITHTGNLSLSFSFSFFFEGRPGALFVHLIFVVRHASKSISPLRRRRRCFGLVQCSELKCGLSGTHGLVSAEARFPKIYIIT